MRMFWKSSKGIRQHKRSFIARFIQATRGPKNKKSPLPPRLTERLAISEVGAGLIIVKPSIETVDVRKLEFAEFLARSSFHRPGGGGFIRTAEGNPIGG